MQKIALFSRGHKLLIPRTANKLPGLSKATTNADTARQIYRAMKLTILLLTVAILHVSARGLSQTVSFSGKDVPLQKVFSAIKQQTGYTVFYDQTVLEKATPITINVKDQPIDQFMRNVLSGQALDYYIEKTTIVITRKQVGGTQSSDLVENVPVEPLPINISGKVTDEEGKPLAGASVTVKGKGKGTTTNVEGIFALNGLTSEDVIVISYTGYVSQSLNVGDRTSFIVKLKINDNPLDQVQILAYGKTTQRYATSNVATVSSKEIEKQPVTNPLLALQAQVPGLVIQQQSGFANGGVAVDVRGQGSWNAGSAPLYVIDGIPYPSQMLPSLFLGLKYSGSGNSQFGAQLGNTLAYINPADIESISILKDADATSIYGSRAAGGAILITTKKGKAGPTKVSVDLQKGWGKLTRFAKLLNRDQYLEMRHEAFQNSNKTPGPSDYDLNGVWDTTRSTDWQRTLLGNTAKWSDANVSISGGNSNTQFYLGGTYHRQTSVYPEVANVYNQKADGHLGVNSVSSNGRFSVQSTISYQADVNHLPGNDVTSYVLTQIPVAPALYNSDGSFNWQFLPNGRASWGNPVASMVGNKYISNVNNLVASARFGYKILNGLELSTNAGYTNMQQSDNRYGGYAGTEPARRTPSRRTANYSNGSTVGWNIEPQLSYNKDWVKLHLEALTGSSFTQQKSDQQQLRGAGYLSDELLKDPKAAASLQYLGTVANLYRYNGYFGRLNFRLAEKYMLSLNGRHDGSSRFGANNKFHSFGSIAGGWIFSNETFFRKLQWLSFAKLTAGYGTAGNEQIGDYQYIGLFYSEAIGNNPYQGVVGLTPSSFPNPYLQWEVQRKMDIKLDMGFVRDRILFSVDYYRNRSSNQLLSYILPQFTGFGGYTTNLPATIQNSGMELDIKTVNVKNQAFSWTTRLNLTIRRNKLTSFPGIAQSSYSDYVIGEPFVGTRRNQYVGVDPQTGLYLFKAADGKSVFYNQLNYPSDATFIDMQPHYFGGLNNTLTYKGLQLDFLFQFSSQKQMIRPLWANYPGQMVNQPVTVLDRWQKPGDIAMIQPFYTSPSFDQLFSHFSVFGSSLFYPESYYIRLKNVSLSWQVPPSWIAKVGANELYLFARAENLLTFTNYTGTDPETGPEAMAPLRMITTGLKVAF